MPESYRLEPGRSDRDLDEQIVRTVLREQFPQQPVHTVVSLGSGWDYDAYLVDDRTVLRFPRRAEVSSRLDREESILGFLRDALGSALAVPHITLKGGPSKHFPHRFFGHDFIRGVSGDHIDVSPCIELATEVGVALTHIHSISPEAALESEIGYEREGVRARFEETAEVVHSVPNFDELAPDPLRWLLSDPAIPPEYSGPPRLVHNDLCPDHIIVGAETGCLSGVIDWSDIALGDPALDFIQLVHWRGWSFTDEVLAAYRLPVDVGFSDRLAFLVRVLGMKWLADAVLRGGDVMKHVAWVTSAFSR